MKKNIVKWIFVITACLAIMLIIVYSQTEVRRKILADYRKLISDPEAMERLQLDPDIRKWKTSTPDNPIDFGFATFDFPFGDISTMALEFSGYHISISNDDILVRFTRPVILKGWPEPTNNPSDYLPTLTYEGGEFKVRDDKYEKYDILLWKQEAKLPQYKFKKLVLSMKPKSILTMAFMKLDDLYVYEKLLEVKNMELNVNTIFSFETQNCIGHVHKTHHIEKNNDYASYHMIVLYDVEEKTTQLCLIVSYNQETPEKDIKKFITTFSFNTELILSNPDTLKPMIRQSLEKYDNFTYTE